MTKFIIVAPMDLQKDYVMEVEIDGKPVLVTCPRDLKMGETIEVDVHYNQPVSTSVSTTVPSQIEKHRTAVDDDFKYGLCSCMDKKTCCRLLWWNTWLLPCIPVAQLLNRFHWSPCATPTKMSRSVTFGIIIGLYIIYNICHMVYTFTLKCSTTSYTSTNSATTTTATVHCSPGNSVGVVMYLISISLTVFIIVMLVRIRMGFRKYYNINGNCCADFLTMWCCSCCSVIQMLRQTHDEDEYHYTCCSCMTGLPDNAPEIV